MSPKNTNLFLLVVSNRSGSNLLFDLLNSTKQIPPIFDLVDLPPDSDDEEILSFFNHLFNHPEASELTNRHWGVAIRGNQFRTAFRYLELMQMAFSTLKWLWLRRGNKIDQALSDARVSHLEIDGLYTYDPPEKHEKSKSKINIEFDLLCKKTVEFLIIDDAWDSFFRHHKIQPHMIFYEDLMNESGWIPTVQHIFDFLKIKYTVPFKFSTERLKQAIDEKPPSYYELIEYVKSIYAPIQYTHYSQ